MSDGFLEVTNDKDEELGQEAIAKFILRKCRATLPKIVDLLVAQATRFGTQQDDQTILLVRVVGPTISA
jgi:serine phosphatase RsbU (regulator of sigma subunit)